MGPHTLSTASGQTLDLDDPRAEQVRLDDIAGGLSRVCRFGAQAVRFHSVAQHAVLVSSLVESSSHPGLALAALHHDSHEAYACDLPAPLKRKLRAGGDTGYEQLCDALDRAIFSALAIPALTASDKLEIKAADCEALMIEAAVLLADGGRGIGRTQDLALEPADRLGHSLPPDQARELFLARDRSLRGVGL